MHLLITKLVELHLQQLEVVLKFLQFFVLQNQVRNGFHVEILFLHQVHLDDAFLHGFGFCTQARFIIKILMSGEAG